MHKEIYKVINDLAAFIIVMIMLFSVMSLVAYECELSILNESLTAVVTFGVWLIPCILYLRWCKMMQKRQTRKRVAQVIAMMERKKETEDAIQDIKDIVFMTIVRACEPNAMRQENKRKIWEEDFQDIIDWKHFNETYECCPDCDTWSQKQCICYAD